MATRAMCAIYLWDLNGRVLQSFYERWIRERGRKLFSLFYQHQQQQQQTNEVKWNCRLSTLHFKLSILHFALHFAHPKSSSRPMQLKCRSCAESVHHRLQWVFHASALVKCNWAYITCNAAMRPRRAQHNAIQHIAVIYPLACIELVTRDATQNRGTVKGWRGIQCYVKYSAMQWYKAVQYSDLGSRPHSILCTPSPLESK